MKNKAFTLIELLAVIIILGILMLIAIPSVTSYINNSRKNTYVSTIQELIKATTTKVNSGDLDMYDTNTTYYIPVSALELENGDPKSPYGDFEEAYIVVTYDGDDYDYYFVGKDETDMGTNKIIRDDIIKSDDIDSGIGNISTDVGVGKRTKITVFDDNGNVLVNKDALKKSNPETGDLLKEICKRADVSTLHVEKCISTSYSCRDFMDIGTEVVIGNEETTDGGLTTGDAFDCDVNGDGTYDPEKERFYYISDYYDTINQSFDDKYATLVFYTNYDTLATEKETERGFAYCEVAEDWHGPTEAVRHLPTTSDWPNVELKSEDRQILKASSGSTTFHVGKNSNSGNVLPVFSYAGSAARILTLMEYDVGCRTGNQTYVDMNEKCIFLNEHTSFFHSSYNRGIWFENPNSLTSSDKDRISITGITNGVYNSNLANAGYGESWNVFGVRPVIDVLKTDMVY